jgi:long-chain fatty acid transport protein
MKRIHTPANRFTLCAGVASACLAMTSGNVLAVTGAELSGYGVKSAGMGGASIALPQDASAAANNPAGMAFVPTSFTINVVGFQGKTDATIQGTKLSDNTKETSLEGGFNYVLNPEFTVGLTLSGSGAGADYGAPYPTPFPVAGAETLKASRKIAELVGSASWKVRPDLALGIGLIYATQQINTQGVVAQIPVAPFIVAVPSHGTQTATGWGARIGAQWNASSDLSLGATYRTKTNMSSFSGYANDVLAYSNGSIDLPSEYGVGVAWRATPSITVAADVLRTEYSKVAANQDPNGPGWSDQDVIKMGVAWALNPTWTLRTGFSSASKQIDGSRAAQNILSPAIDTFSYDFGASMKIDEKSDISFSIDATTSNTLDGSGASAGTSITGKTQVIRFGYQRSF